MEYWVENRTTKAVQSAIDAAAAAGGGRVALAPGEYECLGLRLKSNVELHLSAGARLVGPREPSRIPDFNPPGLERVRPERSQKCLVCAADAENIAVTGAGVIDGQGPSYYNHEARQYPDFDFWAIVPGVPRPRAMQFHNCHGVRLEGITLKDSPGWSLWITHCEDVRVEGIRINGDQRMINNDGIDLDSCRRVAIHGCFLKTGDDCISIRAMRRTPEEHAVCEQVTVSDCVLDSGCQCVRLGCPSDDTIRHVVFHGLTMVGHNNGILCEACVSYLRPTDTGALDIHDILFDAITLECPRHPIHLTVDPGVTARAIRGFTFSNMRISAGLPVILNGNRLCPLEDIRFAQVAGVIHGAPEAFSARFVKGLQMDAMTLTAVDGPPETLNRQPSTSWETT